MRHDADDRNRLRFDSMDRWVLEAPSARLCVIYFEAEDGIRDLVRSRGHGDVYKRQAEKSTGKGGELNAVSASGGAGAMSASTNTGVGKACLLYTSDAADERTSGDVGGRRIIKKKQSVDLADIRMHPSCSHHHVHNIYT